MPKKTDATAPNVLGYALPDSDRGAIDEMLAEAAKAGRVGNVVWYVEPDAKEEAAALAGASSVNLPYFFVGDAPLGIHDEGSNETWPKHRRGGQVFLGNWLAGLGKTEQDAQSEGARKAGLKAAAERAAAETAPAPDNGPQPTDADHLDALHAKLASTEDKLKAERATTRALRKELKEIQEHADGVERASNKLAQRIDTQHTVLKDVDITVRTQRVALRRILDRALVAYQVVDRLSLAMDGGAGSRRRNHAMAELRSIRELAKALLPGTPEAQRDDSEPRLS